MNPVTQDGKGPPAGCRGSGNPTSVTGLAVLVHKLRKINYLLILHARDVDQGSGVDARINAVDGAIGKPKVDDASGMLAAVVQELVGGRLRRPDAPGRRHAVPRRPQRMPISRAGRISHECLAEGNRVCCAIADGGNCGL